MFDIADRYELLGLCLGRGQSRYKMVASVKRLVLQFETCDVDRVRARQRHTTKMRHTKVLVSLLSSTVAVQGASLPVPNQPRTVDPRDETPRGYVPGGSFDAAKFAEPEPEHRTQRFNHL